MTVHDLGVISKKSGGGGTVHKRTVEDSLEAIATQHDIQQTQLQSLDTLEPSDFEDSVTIVAMNRCLDDAPIVTRVLTRDPLDESYDPTRFPIEMESLTLHISLTERSDDVDVIRAISPDK